MAASDDVAVEEGARDVAAVLSQHTRGEGAEARRDLRLAQALDERWHRTSAALGRGEVNLAQARVIVHALDELPTDEVPAEVLVEAEERLVAEAAHYGPRELRILGRKILEVIAPDLFEEQEGKALEREERRARERTSLVSEAFCALVEAMDPTRLPVDGGDATTVIVTISLETLRKELGAGDLGGDGRLSAGEVRRLACTAQVIPAVLDGRSEVLDLGRASRLFKPAQRKAMVVRDKECRTQGAPSRPPGARPITGADPGPRAAGPT